MGSSHSHTERPITSSHCLRLPLIRCTRGSSGDASTHQMLPSFPIRPHSASHALRVRRFSLYADALGRQHQLFDRSSPSLSSAQINKDVSRTVTMTAQQVEKKRDGTEWNGINTHLSRGILQRGGLSGRRMGHPRTVGTSPPVIPAPFHAFAGIRTTRPSRR
jgi:hypothetical protein